LSTGQRVRKAEKFHVPIVSEKFILACLSEKKRVDHAPYLLRDAAAALDNTAGKKRPRASSKDPRGDIDETGREESEAWLKRPKNKFKPKVLTPNSEERDKTEGDVNSSVVSSSKLGVEATADPKGKKRRGKRRKELIRTSNALVHGGSKQGGIQ
jgi:hypothetical protein